nr:MAG TPA: hypothetical protein [Caudoviricetes sp.]
MTFESLGLNTYEVFAVFCSYTVFKCRYNTSKSERNLKVINKYDIIYFARNQVRLNLLVNCKKGLANFTVEKCENTDL